MRTRNESSRRPSLMGRSSPPGTEALGWATLIRSVGSGGMLTISVLFFAEFRHFSGSQVGLALTVGGFAGVAASVPLGHVANGARSRDMASGSIICQGLITVGFLAVHNFSVLIVAAAAASMAEAGSNGARGALIAGLVKGQDRVKIRARLRAITNAGSAAGAAAGGLVLSADTAGLWRGSVAACGACLVGGGLLIQAVPRPKAVAAPAGSRTWGVLHDRPYALLGLINIVLTMNLGLLTVALPIWIASSVKAPTGVFGGLVVLNTVIVVLFQVRATRSINNIDSGGRAMRRAGVLLALCCIAFAAAAVIPTWAAVVVLVLGGLMHATGEMLHAGGSWELSFDMAPEYAHGQYQGMFTMSSQLGNAVAPALTLSLIVNLGGGGWLLLAVLLAVAGAASVYVAKYARRGSLVTPTA